MADFTQVSSGQVHVKLTKSEVDAALKAAALTIAAGHGFEPANSSVRTTFIADAGSHFDGSAGFPQAYILITEAA